MPQPPDSFRTTPEDSSGKLQQMARALRAMPVGTDTHFIGVLRGAHESSIPSQEKEGDYIVERYGRVDHFDRAAEVADALDRVATARQLKLDAPLYPDNPRYRLTVRDALEEMPAVIAGFQQNGDIHIAEAAEEIRNPEDGLNFLNKLRPPEEQRDVDDINTLDNIRSREAGRSTTYRMIGRRLDAIAEAAAAMIQALPPARGNGYDG